LSRALVGLVARVGVDVDGNGHGRILCEWK
jgi:hypothetical protein